MAPPSSHSARIDRLHDEAFTADRSWRLPSVLEHRLEREEIVDRQGKRCLLRRIGRPELVQLPGRAQLDVRAEDRTDRVAARRRVASVTGEPLRALAEGRPVPDGQRAREERVATEEEPARPVE